MNQSHGALLFVMTPEDAGAAAFGATVVVAATAACATGSVLVLVLVPLL